MIVTGPQIDGNTYAAIKNVCGNVSIYLTSNFIGGEVITDFTIDGGTEFTISNIYIDGLPLSLPFTILDTPPSLLQFNLCHTGTTDGTITIDINLGSQIITYYCNVYDTAIADVSSINFGNVSVPAPSAVQFFITIGAGLPSGIFFIYDVDFNLTGLNAPFSLDPSYSSTFQLGLTLSQAIQPENVEFLPTAIGAFSDTLDIEMSTPIGPGSSWTNPVYTLGIPVSGSGVTPPTPPAYISPKLAIMNGISI
jgi:hypothetical protein